MSKKFYMAPESEELMLMTEGFLAASNDIDDGDPVPMDGGGDGGDDDGF
jgi:hypothetical protein